LTKKDIIRLPEIRAANFIHLGSNFVLFLGSKNYFFEQQILMGKAADFIGIGSNFC
jgi:hypothetical protein